VNDAPRAELDLKQAQVLVEMAEIAMGSLSGEIFLPDGWDLLQFVRSENGAMPRARGFYAAGRLGGAGSPRVAVLALGLPWQQYLNWTLNRQGKVEMAAPPAGVAAGAPADARFDKTLGETYARMRGSIWTHLAQALTEGRGTLWVTGKNLAGPLAQLAALDLRPGNTGPERQQAPAAAPACWTFSTAAAGNAAFKTFADASGGAVTNVWAGKSTPVDFFPSAPEAAQGYALPGTLHQVEAPIPELDDPWTERGGPFYLRVLQGTPEGLPTPGAVRNPPPGFERTRAHLLAKVSLVPYQRRQHPGGRTLDVSPFVLREEISAGGVPWCGLFESPSEVVAAFRGTVTCDELMRITADSDVANASFLAPRGAGVHAGALRLYAMLRTELAQRLRVLAAGRPVYLAGHDLGGALAALAALDLRITATDLRVQKVYTFGATPLGNFDFSLLYSARLAADSYLLARDGDFAPRLQLRSAYEPLPHTVDVTGAPEADDATRHSLASYIVLLNPSQPLAQASAAGAAQTPAAAAPGPLTDGERAWMEARLAALGVAAPPRGLEDASAGPPVAGAAGRIVLSTRAEASALAPLVPADGGAPVFAAEILEVAAGNTLVVRAPAGQAVRLVAGRLTLGEGARVTVQSPGEIHAARAELGDDTVIDLVGEDGGLGQAGLSGPHGVWGFMSNQNRPDGGNGEHGTPGGDGEPGGGALFLGSVTGTATVIAGAGNGAPGGPGGPGGHGWEGIGNMAAGNGGKGGNGGPGGNGGRGGVVVVDVALEPGAALNLIPRASTGGPGGSLGRGGKGGTKSVLHGRDGKDGIGGDDGGPGDLPLFSVRHDEAG
jgi:hypothetical protein